MLGSFLMGLVGGQRAMTPLAVVSVAAANGALPVDNGAPRLIARPLVVVASIAIAAAELAGDKMRSAPDRTIPVGLIARFVTSGIAGAALVTSRQRWLGAGVGGATAVLASHAGWRARTAAMQRFGQIPTGLVEDVLVIAAAVIILRTLGKSSGRSGNQHA